MSCKKICLLIVAVLLLNFSHAQVKRRVLTPTIKENVVERLCNVLTSDYIFPDTAARMALHIRKRLAAGAYVQITDPADFARHLTADLRAVYSDKHLNVIYEPALQESTQQVSYIQQAARKMKIAEQARLQNYGFSKAEILSGNIGYVALNGFFDLNDQSKRAVNSAFDFLTNTNALIIDLRLNGGGQADIVHYISSLFFKETIHINDFYIRRTNEFHQNWTEPRARSDVWSAIPVYILVSAYTASAAEEFAYDMQSLHRAVIIGEVTAGAAHPAQAIDIGNNFTVFIPFARPVNPLTGTDWEGCGVKPDVATDAPRALDAAIQCFYKQQINSPDTITANNAKWMYFIYKAKLKPYKMNPKDLKKFVGKYGSNRICFDKGGLIYKTANGYTAGLSPMSKTTFTINAVLDNRQVIFHENRKGRPYKLLLNFNGNLSDAFVRNQDGL